MGQVIKSRILRIAGVLISGVVLIGIGLVGTATQAAAATPAPISGIGSSYASPALESWTNTVANAPYDLQVNWSASNSGTGRYLFASQATDFAVSDLGYVGNSYGQPPSFPFDYVPIVGEGVAFYYNVPGLTAQLQLTSSTACAILTGGITNWDDPALAAVNPGVTLPNLAIVPVTENDSEATNYAMEQWCIAEQPTLWTTFVNQQESQLGGPTDGVTLSATSPNPNWPGIAGGIDDQSTSAVASDVASHAGAIGALQLAYAHDQSGFGTPAENVALVQNASGDFTAPSSLDVTSALAYATPQDSGSQELDFNGLGPNVYNPSTYSYLLTPTTGWDPGKGATLSAFVNYALTLGQQIAPNLGFASLGEPLEHFGINEIGSDVPGAVPLTAAEQAYYTCGDLTPADVVAGNTTPSCSNPGNGLPEAPSAVIIPIAGLAAFGVAVAVRRRRLAPAAS